MVRFVYTNYPESVFLAGAALLDRLKGRYRIKMDIIQVQGH